jgi:hypothetical protein
MNESQHLSEAIDGYFTDPHNEWFLQFTGVIQGLTAEQAATVPAPRFNSVWAVVNHLWVCNQRVLLLLQNQPADRSVLGVVDDWPPIENPMDENAWQADCQRLLAVHRELVKTVASISAEGLCQPIQNGWSERWKVLQGVLAHNSYHTCEIISIRHIQGLWIEEV